MVDYEVALDYLQNLTKFGFNFGLGRITELTRRLDNPQDKLKIVHVGGTNGKGSTCAIMEAVLRQANYRVGVFNSPHLHSYTERYRINGECIAEQLLAEYIWKVKPHLEAMVAEGYEHPTEFEVCTAIAFAYFADQEVDILLLEVGLGGSIDSTNVVTPLVSAITNVTIDHMDYLGNTVSEIAEVKAGIIKTHRPIVTAATGEALTVIEQRSQAEAAPLYRLGQEFVVQLNEADNHGLTFSFTLDDWQFEQLRLNLVGAHQVDNAAVGLAVLKLLILEGFNITQADVTEGLTKVYWPGRMEIVQTEPTVILDGAHNYAGILSLKHSLEQNFSYDSLVLVIGMLGDKEREKIVRELAPLAQHIIVTKPNSPRAGDWEKLAQLASEACPQVEVIEDTHEAVKRGVAVANPTDLVCVTGSLYMIASARELWAQEFREHVKY